MLVERKIDVEWGRSASDQFAVKLVIRTDDRPGLLNQLTSILSTENSQNQEQLWKPFLDDMAKQTGLTIKPFYASDLFQQRADLPRDR